VDLHPPTNPLFWPALSVFMVLFETETAWSFIYTDVAKLLTTKGFNLKQQRYYAGGSLQVIQAQK
jgi:demethylmenaquinone methyltransferase/2-methoxy-6-polyprenyl-1,4-benzoquinol methylase